MVVSSRSALGIIFPNSYDELIPDLVNVRLMASIPFASRYRLIDFVLSSMVNCGIGNIAVLVRQNYHSLMDHLGSGREWDLVRKNGGLNIFPPYAEKTAKLYVGHVDALAHILDFLRAQKEKYVVMADTNIAANINFDEMIREHIASGADISVAYRQNEIPESALRDKSNVKGYYYTLKVDEEGRVRKMYINPKDTGVHNLGMNIHVVARELLIDLINDAYLHGLIYFERDILMQKLEELNIHGFHFKGYAASITGIKSYFDENMKLLDDKNLDALFDGPAIYTKIRDDNPTRYIQGAVAKNVMVADGCIIEGEVENSVLFRGVRIAKGAKVKNCILMQDTIVEENAKVEYTITDKNVRISAGKEMKGTDSYPMYIAKNHIV